MQRYHFEAQRHYGILDERLAQHPYVLGERYTIVDIAVWGWSRVVRYVLGEDARSRMPNLRRVFDEICARPAAVRANALKEQHAFKTEFDDNARRHLFWHLAA